MEKREKRLPNGLLLSVEIPLQVPVTVKAADGGDAERGSITIRRPQTRHVKRLAVIAGREIVKGFMDGEGDKVDMAKLAAELFGTLLDEQRLEALTALVGDLCGVSAGTIDDLDPLDVGKIGEALIDFFPALRSFVSEKSPPTSPISTDGSPAR